jgi:endonuclease/exonuclease/phosphatase family metal-dependent hydrolase
MRRTSAWAVRALCGVLVLAATTSAGAEPIRVVTFNLFHGGPLGGFAGDGGGLEARLAIVVAELRRLRPDVIALQEASIGSRRGDVARRLARELGFYVAHASTTERVFGPSILSRLAVRLIDFSEGPAVLSRWPIVSQDVVELARCSRPLDTRVLLRVDLDAPGGRVRVYSTHTSGQACQLRHIERVARERRTMLPSILMGDFNASEHVPALASMRRHAGFVDAFRAANPHEPGFTDLQRPGAATPTVSQRYDYIFVVPGARTGGSVLASRVVLNAPRRYADGSVLWPSDHYGVLAVLDLTAR